MLKRPKAGEAQGAPAAVLADNGCAAGGMAASAPSSIPAFLQVGQVCNYVLFLRVLEPCRLEMVKREYHRDEYRQFSLCSPMSFKCHI